MRSDVAIVGTGRTSFGEHYEKDPDHIVEESWLRASAGVGIVSKDLEAIFSSSCLITPTNKTLLPEGNLSELTKLHVPMENDKSFSSAFHAAYNSIVSGEYGLVLVGGFEKMTDRWDKIRDDLMMLEDPLSYHAGLTSESNHEFMLRYYLKENGISGESLEKFNRALALIPVKNHLHATNNPNAQYPRKITVEQVLNARKEARKPLGLYDFAPISDGATALILATPEIAKRYSGKPVYVKGCSSATDFITFTSRDEKTSFIATRIAMENALRKAGIKREDIKVAELYDQSSLIEMISLEDLGFSKKGEGWKDVHNSLTKGNSYQLNGRELFVNTNGGLKADGNPLGATGGAQFYEIIKQLRGEAVNQVSEARYGLVSEIEGFGTKSYVTILGRD
jgi:acetyl-CoA C-acetyltransferase